ncbi:pyocin knob domain-containing protein [Pseudomonas anguilliseptica]|uniref:pyocin knob domain-containing protein n=1 Tax=Pseudomonas anguilliseptica TaxID=53406 RepID=UPI00325B1714
MRRINTPTAAEDLFGPGKSGFRNGDPALAILATRLNAEFFNSLQEEVAGVVEGAGLALIPEDNGQLLLAVKNLIVANALKIKAPIAGDLNTYTADIRGSGSNLTNAPGGDAGFWYLDVQKHGTVGTYCRQIAARVTGAAPDVYVRHCNNGVWTGWARFITEGTAATEAAAGVARVATQVQTNAGADDATIVTPKKLRFGFAVSLTANGYIALPSWLGGLILQWGTSVNIGYDQRATVSYPIAFPTACFIALANFKAPAAFTDHCSSFGVANITNTSFQMENQWVYSSGPNSWPGVWFALGV